MVNQVNVDKWIGALRDPANKQINARLCEVIGKDEVGRNQFGFCCLGVGAVLAGDEIEVEAFEADDFVEAGVEAYVGHKTELPSGEFHDWIEDGGEDGDDVSIDWPEAEGWFEQGTPEEAAQYEAGYKTRPFLNYTCAGLNDACHLTFPQIADVIAYFGIKPRA